MIKPYWIWAYILFCIILKKVDRLFDRVIKICKSTLETCQSNKWKFIILKISKLQFFELLKFYLEKSLKNSDLNLVVLIIKY